RRRAGRVFGQRDDRVDRALGVEVAADLGRAGPVNVGAAFVAEVFDHRVQVDRRGRFLAGGRVGRRTFGAFAAFGEALFEARLDEPEGGRVDFVLGPFVADEGAVGEQRQAAVEVDRLAFDRAVRGHVHPDFGQRFVAAALERAGEADFEVAVV